MFVGIDPSLTRTGLCAFNTRSQLLEVAVIESRPVDNATTSAVQQTYDRCLEIMGNIDNWLLRFPTDLAYEFLIEGPALAPHEAHHLFEMGIWYATFFYRFANEVNTITNFAHGVNTITIIPPSTLKKFLGKGNMSKNDVPMVVYKRWGVEFERDPGRDKAHAFALWKLGNELHDGNYAIEATKRRGAGRSYTGRAAKSTTARRSRYNTV
jgi:Holliday junction resolvasome RuvABC endonuclease subunit